MVSTGPVILCAAALFAAETPAPAPSLTPESRGDILMARKMYREAIDLYRDGPQDSAII